MTTDTSPGVSPLAPFYERAQAAERGHLSAAEGLALIPEPPRLSLWNRFSLGREGRAIEKSIQTNWLKANDKVLEAAAQGTVVNQSMAAWGLYDGVNGMAEPTGQTFGLLRRWAHVCEPLAAIHNKCVEQIAPYCQPTASTLGYVRSAGFHVRMTDKKATPTAQDRKAMDDLTRFFEEAGYCPPPEEERPVGWQPGLEHYVRSLMRDQLTLDWTATRTWASAKDARKYPIVSFAAIDAGLVRNMRRKVVTVEDFVPVLGDADHRRTNLPAKTQIRKVKVEEMDSTSITEEFTDAELFTAFMRPRTDESSNGYGYSVEEQAMNAITIWCQGRDQNALRFSRDSLPRGILTILGQMDGQQFADFQKGWKSMMQGLKNRWTVPILKGTPVAGSSVQFQPFDLSPRDMEYSQFMFSVGLWLHCLYGMHPDETGFSASSPFRPPLSEASPAENLKYSQDTCMSPRLRWLQTVLNRHVLWRIAPDRRYTFEFLGVDDTNEADDVALSGQRLNFGITNPKMEWAERDIRMPAWVMNHPAADLPMPFAQGVQLLQAMQQQNQQADQAAQQQDMDADQQAHEQGQDEAQQGLQEDDQEHDHDLEIQQAEQQKELLAQQSAGGGKGAAGGKAPNALAPKPGMGQNAATPKNAAPGFMGQRKGGGASTRPVAKAVTPSIQMPSIVMRLGRN